MGLFDDILKKPENQGDTISGVGGAQASGQGGTATQAVATPTIVIQKTSEETVFGPSKELATPEKPHAVEPTIHADSDASSILMPTAMETSVAPEAPMIESFISQSGAISVEGLPPMDTPLVSPVITSEKIAPITINPTPAPQANPENRSLLESVMGGSPQNDILSMATANQEVVVAPAEPVAKAEVQENFSTPRDFIERSLASIATMMQNIEERHNSKITEAEGYKAEKLRFTDLEKTAYAEASIMDKERDHAIHMKKILEAELARDEANRNGKEFGVNHVESTLSEIGNEHPIGTHKHTHKKHDTHDTEPVLMAS